MLRSARSARWPITLMALVLPAVAWADGAPPASASAATSAAPAASTAVEPKREGRCEPDVAVWTERASRATGARITPLSCPAGLVLVSVEGAGCDYEVRKKGGFRRTAADTYGVSPIVNRQWGDAPDPMKKGLATVLSSLERDPSLTIREAPSRASAPGPDGASNKGIFAAVIAIVLTVVAAGALVWLRRRRRPAATDAPAPEPRHDGPWALGWGTTVFALVALGGINALALVSTDPDFYLPDPFRWLDLGVLFALLVSGFFGRRWAGRAIRSLVFTIVVVMSLLEIHARVRDVGDTAKIIQQSDDTLLRYHYKPNVTLGDVHINAYGLMDVERTMPKPSDVYRVVVLTGSIANDGAVPFERRFFRRLEEQLAGAAPEGKKIEVVNVSCEGFNTMQQVRMLEKVGLLYEPDLVVVGYMLTAASLQNGAYRRIGNSFFMFRFLPTVARARTSSVCSMFAPFHDNYSFELIVRNSLERLRLLSEMHKFKVVVAVLPVVERFDDPTCARLYDKVMSTARAAGLPAVRVPDAFVGESPATFEKPGRRDDVCHPNAAGHERIGDTIAKAVRARIGASASAP